MDDGILLNLSYDTPKSKPVKPVKQEKPAKPTKPERHTESAGGSRKRHVADANDRKPKRRQNTAESARRQKNDEIDKNTFVSSLFSNTEVSTEEHMSTAQELGPSNAPTAGDTFAEIGLEPKMCEFLETKLRLKTPTQIQRAVVPELLKSTKDLFIQAQTGSGKTLSFCLPIFNTLMKQDIDRTSGLFAIVLAPTRELAHQIYGVLEQLHKVYVKIVPGIVIGGEKKKSEKARLRKGVNILVSTPGRLLDHLKTTKNLSENLGLVRWLVLDEGDRLMELGFEETLASIVRYLESASTFKRMPPGLPSRRVNILCSATMKNDVEKLGEIALVSPKIVALQKNTTSVPDQLVQEVVVVPAKLRLVTLCGVLKNTVSEVNNTKTIVFVSCADAVEFYFDTFTNGGSTQLQLKRGRSFGTEKNDPNEILVSASTAPQLGKCTVYKLHGNLPQHVRTRSLAHFASNKENAVLFCTDVVSRGIDLPHISTVVEYDPPFSVDDHLHRVGRTARAGEKGTSVLFLLPGAEEKYLQRLEKHHMSGLKMTSYEKILTRAFEIVDPENEKNNRKWDSEATTWHLNVERWIIQNASALRKAQDAFTSHVRAYTTHTVSERDCFSVKMLHLGHLAKSFGLRDPPKKIKVKIGQDGKPREKVDAKTKMLSMARLAEKSQSSEFNFM